MTHDNRGRLAVELGGAWRIYWGNGPLPAGAVAIGTVTRGNGDTGALLRMPTGVYVQGNANVIRGLPAKIEAAVAAAKPRRGGARPGGGRPAADGARGMTRRNVTLDDETVDAARKLGDGDLSLGLRRAVIIAISHHAASRPEMTPAGSAHRGDATGARRDG